MVTMVHQNHQQQLLFLLLSTIIIIIIIAIAVAILLVGCRRRRRCTLLLALIEHEHWLPLVLHLLHHLLLDRRRNTLGQRVLRAHGRSCQCILRCLLLLRRSIRRCLVLLLDLATVAATLFG